MGIDLRIKEAPFTVGNIAKIARTSEPLVKRHLVKRVIRPTGGGGGPGKHWTFTVVDAIAESVGAAFREMGLGTRWADAATRFVANLSSEEIETACAEGRVSLVPTNPELTEWALVPLPEGLPPGLRRVPERLSLATALRRTQEGIRQIVASQTKVGSGRRSGLGKLAL